MIDTLKPDKSAEYLKHTFSSESGLPTQLLHVNKGKVRPNGVWLGVNGHFQQTPEKINQLVNGAETQEKISAAWSNLQNAATCLNLLPDFQVSGSVQAIQENSINSLYESGAKIREILGPVRIFFADIKPGEAKLNQVRELGQYVVWTPPTYEELEDATFEYLNIQIGETTLTARNSRYYGTIEKKLNEAFRNKLMTLGYQEQILKGGEMK